MLVCLALLACEEIPTRTVARCYPENGGCEEFTGINAQLKVDLAMGNDLYRLNCARCHGPDGRGMGFVDRGDFAASAWQQRWSDDQLMGVITAGRGREMPGHRFSAVQLLSVAAHVRSFDEARGRADETIKKKEGQGPNMGGY